MIQNDEMIPPVNFIGGDVQIAEQTPFSQTPPVDKKKRRKVVMDNNLFKEQDELTISKPEEIIYRDTDVFVPVASERPKPVAQIEPNSQTPKLQIEQIISKPQKQLPPIIDQTPQKIIQEIKQIQKNYQKIETKHFQFATIPHPEKILFCEVSASENHFAEKQNPKQIKLEPRMTKFTALQQIDFATPFKSRKEDGTIDSECCVCKKQVQHVQMIKTNEESDSANPKRNFFCRYSSSCYCAKCGSGAFNELSFSKLQPRIIAGRFLHEYYQSIRTPFFSAQEIVQRAKNLEPAVVEWERQRFILKQFLQRFVCNQYQQAVHGEIFTLQQHNLAGMYSVADVYKMMKRDSPLQLLIMRGNSHIRQCVACQNVQKKCCGCLNVIKEQLTDKTKVVVCLKCGQFAHFKCCKAAVCKICQKKK